MKQPKSGALSPQDNRATAAPMFAVQQRMRIYGLESGYGDGWTWVDEEGNEADPDAARVLSDNAARLRRRPLGWRRLGYRDTWEFVTACFTEQGCKDFIRINGHNLKDPRIYAYGSYRNHEWQTVRDHLLKAAHDG